MQATVKTMSNTAIYRINGRGIRTKGLVVSDVDGTLTDGAVFYSDNGSRTRKFSVIDGHGVQLLKENGFDVLLISGEDDKNIRLRARKLRVDFLHCPSGTTKQKVLTSYVNRNYLMVPEVYVIGDDQNDLSIIDMSAFSATPQNSIIHKKFQDRVHLILESEGGCGAFREYAEAVLEANSINPYGRQTN